MRIRQARRNHSRNFSLKEETRLKSAGISVTDNRLLAQGATSGLTTYNYDAVGNLQNFVYPNGVTSAYTYDALNRLTQMGSSKNATALSKTMPTRWALPGIARQWPS